MPFVTGHLQNKRILVPIGIRAFSDDPFVPENFNFYQFRALVDTGATCTSISRNVVNRVGLKGRGQVPVGNVKRTEMHESYLFYVGIWPDSHSEAPPAIFGIGDAVLGIDGGDSRFYDVILGMDIIMRGALRLAKGGHFSLEF